MHYMIPTNTDSKIQVQDFEAISLENRIAEHVKLTLRNEDGIIEEILGDAKNAILVAAKVGGHLPAKTLQKLQEKILQGVIPEIKVRYRQAAQQVDTSKPEELDRLHSYLSKLSKISQYTKQFSIRPQVLGLALSMVETHYEMGLKAADSMLPYGSTLEPRVKAIRTIGDSARIDVSSTVRQLAQDFMELNYEAAATIPESNSQEDIRTIVIPNLRNINKRYGINVAKEIGSLKKRYLNHLTQQRILEERQQSPIVKIN